MSKKIKVPKPIKGYGFTGVWLSGEVGWMGLSHIGGSRKYPDNPSLDGERKSIMKGERLFMCEVILKPVLDKKGRPITKIVK